MTKVAVYRNWCGILLVLLFSQFTASAQFGLSVTPVDKDSSILKQLSIQKSFIRREECAVYISRLPELLTSKGYPAASVDSIYYDSTHASVWIFFGEPYQLMITSTDSTDPAILQAVRWGNLKSKNLTFRQFENLRSKMLDYLENNGYPFGQVQLDSIQFRDNTLLAALKVNKGPRYHIDSVRNLGEARISDAFLHFHLGIRKGSYYRRDKLEAISRKISELPYVQEQQPFNLTMLGTGSVVNLYLKPKKSSQINILVGLLPSNGQTSSNKLQVTGEALINLRNVLGNGETIGLNWQQLQLKSPRLNVLFQQPYLFNSPFGINFNFDLFKKDTSYVNISLLLGIQYALSSNQSGSIFFQNLHSNLLTVDTIAVKNSRQLPQVADISSYNLGINYDWFNTDYRLSPRKGNEVQLSASAGTKNIRRNNVIVKLSDPSDPSFNFNSLYDTLTLKAYQFRVRLSAAHYFRLSTTSTLKTIVTGGWFQSPDIFRNELFQIGGYKLLRGFDEESIFASSFAVTGIEYRYFIGMNSFLFAFTDFGVVENKSSIQQYNNFLGSGLGMAFETKAGVFNISYAIGKRGGEKLNLRQSKIHLGYVNYF
ncbi:MAG TPA: hypothetical protein VM012_10725 [Flavitalea sp.]|nr:hypothetical protein [Flavitalea sp.]